MKERQRTSEELLVQSQTAYIQLDEHYKGLLDKLEAENSNALKQQQMNYQQKI